MVATLLALVLAACGGSQALDIESLGLAVEPDISAGSQFEVAVPAQPGVTVELVSAPPGVEASVFQSVDGDSVVLTVAVDAGTPRGAYNLALRAVQDGEEYELGWPFEVTEPGLTSATLPSSVAGLLTVDSPQIGAVYPSPSELRGTSSTGQVGYRLVGGGDIVLAEGTLDVVDGAFSAVLEFTNTCCTEMQLEVFHPGAGGMVLTVPLSYPEA